VGTGSQGSVSGAWTGLVAVGEAFGVLMLPSTTEVAAAVASRAPVRRVIHGAPYGLTHRQFCLDYLVLPSVIPRHARPQSVSWRCRSGSGNAGRWQCWR